MSKSKTYQECFVTEADFEHFIELVNRGELQRTVLDFMEREPHIAVAIANRSDLMDRLMTRLNITGKSAESLKKQMLLAAWIPVLAQSRGYRREWDEFLPSTDDSKGGGQ